MDKEDVRKFVGELIPDLPLPGPYKMSWPVHNEIHELSRDVRRNGLKNKEQIDEAWQKI